MTDNLAFVLSGEYDCAMKHSLLQRLGLRSGKSDSSAGSSLGQATVLARDLEAALESLPAERVRYLAALSGLMGRVAVADGHISEDELGRMGDVLRAFTHLAETETETVVSLMRDKFTELMGLENHIYTREINELADHSQKLEVLSCLFAVAAADDTISPEENEAVRIIAKGLMLTHSDFINVRSLYRQHLSVLKNLPK